MMARPCCSKARHQKARAHLVDFVVELAPPVVVVVEAATVVVAVELEELPAGVVVAVELDLEVPAAEVLDGAAVVVALLDLLELVLLPAETAAWVVVMEVVVLVVDEVKVWPLT